MKKFTFKGVLENFKSSLSQTQKTVNDVEEFLKKENFAFSNVIKHGFPHSASSLAHDPVQNIVAIGTSNGYIRIFGKPSVECDLQHESPAAVQQLIFLINEGLLISVCSDDIIHLWNIKDTPPVITHSLKFQRERITYVHLPFQSKWLYVGTYKGNVHVINVETFKLSGYIINWNKTIELISKNHPGAIIHVTDCPIDNNKLLIGFESGTIVLWDLKNKSVDGRYIHNIPLTSISWHFEGKTFISSHTDGSLITWNVKLLSGLTSKPLSIVFPHARSSEKVEKCHSIDKVEWKETKSGDNLYIFSGGLMENIPTITIMHGKSTTVLEMEHHIIDFVSLSKSPYVMENIEPSAVIVLFCNDLIIIDLTTPGYPCFENPFALDMHECEITILKYYSDCPAQIIPMLYSCGMKQKKLNYSDKSWPLNGGESGKYTTSYPELLITGHSDGTIKFWDSSALNLQILYRLKTNKIFERGTTSTCHYYHYKGALPDPGERIMPDTQTAAARDKEASTATRTAPNSPPYHPAVNEIILAQNNHDSNAPYNTKTHHQNQPNPDESFTPLNTTTGTSQEGGGPPPPACHERFTKNKKIALPVTVVECDVETKALVLALKKKRYSFLALYSFNKQETTKPITVLRIPNPVSYNPTNIETTTTNRIEEVKDTVSSNPSTTTKYIIKVKEGPIKQSPGFQVDLVLDFHSYIKETNQLHFEDEHAIPNIKTIKIYSTSNIIAIGTSFGLCLVDYVNKCILLNLSTPDFYGTNDPFSRNYFTSKTFPFLRMNRTENTENLVDKCKSPSMEVSNYHQSDINNTSVTATSPYHTKTSPPIPLPPATSSNSPPYYPPTAVSNNRAAEMNTPAPTPRPPPHNPTVSSFSSSKGGYNYPNPFNTTGGTTTSSGGIAALAKAKIQKAHSFISFSPLSSSFSSPPPQSTGAAVITNTTTTHKNYRPSPPPPPVLSGGGGPTRCNAVPFLPPTSQFHTSSAAGQHQPSNNVLSNINAQQQTGAVTDVNDYNSPYTTTNYYSAKQESVDPSNPTTANNQNSYAKSSIQSNGAGSNFAGGSSNYIPGYNLQFHVNNLQSPSTSPLRSASSNAPSSELENVTSIAFYRGFDENFNASASLEDYYRLNGTGPNNVINAQHQTQKQSEPDTSGPNLNTNDYPAFQSPPGVLWLWLGTSYGSIMVLKFSTICPDTTSSRSSSAITTTISPTGTIFRLKGRILHINFVGATLGGAALTNNATDVSDNTNVLRLDSVDSPPPPLNFTSNSSSATVSKKQQPEFGLHGTTGGGGVGRDKGTTSFFQSNKKAQHSSNTGPGTQQTPTNPSTPLSNTSSFDSLSHSYSFFQQLQSQQQPSTGASTSGSETLRSQLSADNNVTLLRTDLDNHHLSTMANPIQQDPCSSLTAHTTAADNSSSCSFNKEFAVLVSESQACSISLRSTSYMSVLYKVKIANEHRKALTANIVDFNNHECLTCYTTNGNILIYSVPSFRILLDVFIISPTNLRLPVNSFCFGNNGNGLYLCSPSEIQKFTFSADMCKNLGEMTSRVYKVKETPEPPKSSFFSNFFNAPRNVALDREELFGEANSGKGSRTAAVLLQDINQKVQGTVSGPLQRARQAAAERGEKLSELDDKTGQMLIHSENYSKTAHDVLQKYKDKKWYQF